VSIVDLRPLGTRNAIAECASSRRPHENFRPGLRALYLEWHQRAAGAYDCVGSGDHGMPEREMGSRSSGEEIFRATTVSR
jgi:hypothetical protein